MVAFVVEVIAVSIVVSAISYALRLVPRYPKRIFGVLQQVLNTGLLTLLLTYLIVNEIEPGWVVMGSMVFLCLIVSIIVINFIAKSRVNHSPPSDPSRTP